MERKANKKEKGVKVTKKRKGFELQTKTVKDSKNKVNYLFFKTANGAYHAFMEVAAKDAALKCIKKPDRSKNTRQLCKELLGF